MNSRAKNFWFLVSLIVIGLYLRLDFLIPNNFVIDADEGIVGLMALHISQGKPWPIFYYGQHYMGSFEAILAAGVFKMFGPSPCALQMVPLFFSLLLIPLSFAITKEVAGIVAARIAALLVAIPPLGLVVWSAKARGGFVEVICLGGLALLLTIRMIKSQNFAVGRSLLIGLILGFGWWINNQIVFFLLPIAACLFLALLRAAVFPKNVQQIALHGFTGAIAFLVGGLPFWYYNLTHNFASFGMLQRAHAKELSEHVSGFFSTALPILLGGKRFWQENDIYLGSSLITFAVYGAIVITLVWQRRRAILGLCSLRIDQQHPVELLSLFVCACAAVFIGSSFGYLVQAPRYLLPLYIGLFPLVGIALERWWIFSRSLGLIGIAVLLGIHVTSSYAGGRAIPGEPYVYEGQRVAKSHQELISWLQENQFPWVRTNYWIGYRLAFETQEQIRFSVYQEPNQDRIPEYVSEAEQYGINRMPLVLVPAQAKLVKRALDILWYDYKQTQKSGYEVFYDIHPRQTDLHEVDPKQIEVESSPHTRDPHLANDQHLDTRWGTAEPQKPGMTFTITLNEVRTLRGFSFDSGIWTHDFPRGLQIELELESGEKRIILPEEDWIAVHYYLENTTEARFMFIPLPVRRIILTQTGTDSFFDWSIAEVAVWE